MNEFRAIANADGVVDDSGYDDEEAIASAIDTPAGVTMEADAETRRNSYGQAVLNVSGIHQIHIGSGGAGFVRADTMDEVRAILTDPVLPDGTPVDYIGEIDIDWQRGGPALWSGNMTVTIRVNGAVVATASRAFTASGSTTVPIRNC